MTISATAERTLPTTSLSRRGKNRRAFRFHHQSGYRISRLRPGDRTCHRAWKVACESIDLDEVPLSDIADMISGFDCETITDFRLFNTGAFDDTPWQQALGELLLRLRIEKDDYQWIQCPNSESAVNMMNMVMDAHMPKDFFDGFVCGDEEYGLDEEAHEMASGRKEIDTQTETKDAPVKDTQNIK